MESRLGGCVFRGAVSHQRLNSLLKKSLIALQPLKGRLILKSLWHRLKRRPDTKRNFPALCKAGDENRPLIAAVNCSTPSRQNRACWGTPALRHPKSKRNTDFSAAC